MVLPMNLELFRRGFRSLFLPSDRLFYLSVFRVFAGIILLWKILVLWPCRDFLFGPKGVFEYPGAATTHLNFIPATLIRDHLSLFFVIYAIAAALMIFGIGRRWTMAVVIVAQEINNDLYWVLLDGGDNLLQFSVLYLFFADSFAHFSLSKSAPPKQEYAISHFMTNIAVAAIIGHLCLAYTISGLSKAHAEVWYNGTAMYYILGGERYQGTKTWNVLLANNAFFNVMCCYTTIIWESTFAFAVFVKKIRIPVLLMGVSMHSSIFVLMMIQTFQIIYVFHYGFFFTDAEWAGFLAMVRSRFGWTAVTSEATPAFDGIAASTAGSG